MNDEYPGVKYNIKFFFINLKNVIIYFDENFNVRYVFKFFFLERQFVTNALLHLSPTRLEPQISKRKNTHSQSRKPSSNSYKTDS